MPVYLYDIFLQRKIKMDTNKCFKVKRKLINYLIELILIINPKINIRVKQRNEIGLNFISYEFQIFLLYISTHLVNFIFAKVILLYPVIQKNVLILSNIQQFSRIYKNKKTSTKEMWNKGIVLSQSNRQLNDCPLFLEPHNF